MAPTGAAGSSFVCSLILGGLKLLQTLCVRVKLHASQCTAMLCWFGKSSPAVQQYTAELILTRWVLVIGGGGGVCGGGGGGQGSRVRSRVLQRFSNGPKTRVRFHSPLLRDIRKFSSAAPKFRLRLRGVPHPLIRETGCGSCKSRITADISEQFGLTLPSPMPCKTN